jgi:hypothetical protein
MHNPIFRHLTPIEQQHHLIMKELQEAREKVAMLQKQQELLCQPLDYHATTLQNANYNLNIGILNDVQVQQQLHHQQLQQQQHQQQPQRKRPLSSLMMTTKTTSSSSSTNNNNNNSSNSAYLTSVLAGKSDSGSGCGPRLKRLKRRIQQESTTIATTTDGSG